MSTATSTAIQPRPLRVGEAAPYNPEILTSAELAARLKLPESWIRDQVRSRAVDPIPHERFGRYVRFDWNSPELRRWLEKRSRHK